MLYQSSCFFQGEVVADLNIWNDTIGSIRHLHFWFTEFCNSGGNLIYDLRENEIYSVIFNSYNYPTRFLRHPPNDLFQDILIWKLKPCASVWLLFVIKCPLLLKNTLRVSHNDPHQNDIFQHQYRDRFYHWEKLISWEWPPVFGRILKNLIIAAAAIELQDTKTFVTRTLSFFLVDRVDYQHLNWFTCLTRTNHRKIRLTNGKNIYKTKKKKNPHPKN